MHVSMFSADVHQMFLVKEETPEDHRPYADLHDPKHQHIKEEQEGVYISMGGEQLDGKVGDYAISFQVTATIIKIVDDE